jgi:hypothetical protein
VKQDNDIQEMQKKVKKEVHELKGMGSFVDVKSKKEGVPVVKK